jgi:hypothetical protein
MKQYKQVGKLSFSENTPDVVCGILLKFNRSGERIRIFLGDSETGLDWMEEYDIMGHIGNSTGNLKVPLMINNSRSIGGPEIMAENIVKITHNKEIIYKHEKYHLRELLVSGLSVTADGETIATFESEEKSMKYVLFLEGKSNRR